MIRLYRANWSTNCERVALALAHKRLAVESVLIDYADRSPVEAVSGQGLVPVIVDGGEVVNDSSRILAYLEHRYPDHPPLFPADPARHAQVELFLERFERVWKLPPNAIERELAGEAPDQSLIERHAAQLAAWLDRFEAMLDGGDYLLGDFSAADCSAFPFLKYARGRDPADDELFHRVCDRYQQLGDDHPRLAAWIDRVDARPRTYGEVAAG